MDIGVVVANLTDASGFAVAVRHFAVNFIVSP